MSKFQFYQMFPTTCPIYKEIDPYDGIDIDAEIAKSNEDSQNIISNSSDGYLYAMMSISDFAPGIAYKFVYDINGVEQPPLSADKEGVLVVRVSDAPGKYTYMFKRVIDLDGNLIKEINKPASVTVGLDGVTEIPEVIKDPTEGKVKRPTVAKMTDEERNKIIANRILLQSDGTVYFKGWVERLDAGYNTRVGEKVMEEVLAKFDEWYKLRSGILRAVLIKKRFKKNYYRQSQKDSINEGIEKTIKEEILDIIPSAAQLISDGIIKENTLNEYVFQNNHEIDPTNVPVWLTAQDYICKFTYDNRIDKVLSDRNTSFGETKRTRSKVKKYKKERKIWWQVLRDCANAKNVSDVDESSSFESDGYNIMAEAIIDYWKSTVVQPFKPTPPIPPCNVTAPLGGIYTPISYGSKTTLANDLRRAWNTGKRFSKQPLTPAASKLVATAVSVSCAKHLLKLKFLYLGGITTPAGPVPMIGFVPVAF
jgi:hypothetical protein